MSLHVREVAHNSSEYDKTVELRDKILRKPLGLSFSPDDLAKENDSAHVACFQDDDLLGCLILQPDGSGLKMRQVAVSEKSQGMGIGKLLVEFSEQYAKSKGFSNIHMHARESAVGFYLKLGYSVEGETFEEVTIPHRFMIKRFE